MSKSAEDNLAPAFAAESRVAVRNQARAARADNENRPAEARLLRAVARAESVHARRLLNLMRGKIGDTDTNLAVAFEQEIAANIRLYADMAAAARSGERKVIAAALEQTLRVESAHLDLYRALNEDPGSEAVYHVCSICGHVAVDSIPERCPVCKAVPEKFETVE